MTIRQTLMKVERKLLLFMILITTRVFKRLISENFATRLAQANLVILLKACEINQRYMRNSENVGHIVLGTER